MSISSMANRWWSFYRQTSYFVDSATATASMAVDRALDSSSYIQVKVAGGTTGSGEVTVTGTDTSGSALSLALSFSSNGTLVTTSQFATVTGLTTTGLATEATVPTVSAQAVSSDGTPNLIRYSIAANRPVLSMTSGTPAFPAVTPGTYEKDFANAMVDYEGSTWTPREDDVAVDDTSGQEWVIVGVREVRMGFGNRPNHYSMRCTLQGT